MLAQWEEMKDVTFLDKQEIWKQTSLTKQELKQIMNTTLIKYKIMRVRAKISFSAFQKNMVITEMIMK